MTSLQVVFDDDPAVLLERAGGFLAANPVVASVLATRAAQLAAGADDDSWPAGVPRWFATVVDEDDTVVGVAMRTATFGRFPIFVLPMPERAAVRLAEALLERDQVVGAVNGSLPAGRTIADTIARRSGLRVRVETRTRLFHLPALVPPRQPVGETRPARADELDLLVRWYRAFMEDADRQGGRTPGQSAHDQVSSAELGPRVEAREMRLWVVDDEPVSLTAFRPPAYGVARIGPVYTPVEHRGHGYASALVATVSAELLAVGAVPALYTDRDNPISNKIYERLGYLAVEDQANLLIG